MPRRERHSGSAGELSARAQQLLKALVEHYIREGQPVGSRTLSKDARIGLSPASIRNVMSDLEELGLLASPHTSAGRVPTALGYRTFVDSLLTVRALERNEVDRIQLEVEAEGDRQRTLESASQILSEFTNFAGLVTVPRMSQETLRRVEFLSLSDNQVLVILIVNAQEVQNRVIRTERRYSDAELLEAANYLNRSCVGMELSTVRDHLLADLNATRDTLNRMMAMVIEMADKAFVPQDRFDDLVVSGQTRLMEHGELADVDRLRQLFEAFNRKRDILHLLDQSQRAQGVQLFIGEESGYEMLDACTVVASPYGVDGEVVGVLGVIGPTRMAYERIIAIVDVTARLVGAALNQRH